MAQKQRINFKRSYKLYSACRKAEEVLPHADLEYVYFLNGYAYASDSHILVRVPLNECTTFDEEDIRKLDNTRIHYSLLRVLYGFSEVEISEDTKPVGETYDELTLKRTVVLSASRMDNDIQIVLEEIDKHPDFANILDFDGERQPINALGIKAKLLNTLTEAMGAVAIKLRFTQANGKVFVNDFADESNAIGIIMPLQLDPALPGFEE